MSNINMASKQAMFTYLPGLFNYCSNKVERNGLILLARAHGAWPLCVVALRRAEVFQTLGINCFDI